MNLFRKMYTQSFFHTSLPFRREEKWGGCCGFAVSVTLPVWTSKRLSNLPKVTNNSLTFPDDFQYNMCSSTSLLWRVCISVLLWLPVYDDFPFFGQLPVLRLKAQFEGKLVYCSGNKSVCKVDNGWAPGPFCLHSSFSKLGLENLEGMFLGLWNVLPSSDFSLQLWHVAVSSAARILTPLLAVWSNSQILLEELLEVHGATPWCIQQGQNKTAKQ